MVVTSFHLSSASPEARANGSTEADFTLPLRPGIQIPATAQPTAYLSSLLFPNELANTTAATKTSTVTMGLGDGNVEWSNGGAAQPYWFGIQYTNAAGNTTHQLCVPLTKDLSLPSAWHWSGILEGGATNGFHGLKPSAIVDVVNKAIQFAVNSAPWHTATGQTSEKMPLSGSTGQGIFSMEQPAVQTPTPYVSGGANESGVMQVNMSWGGADMMISYKTKV